MTIHRYVLFGLLIAGLLAAFSLWPAMADDIVIDESGVTATGTGSTGDDGATGSPGINGQVIEDKFVGNPGGTGGNGQTGGTGPAGGDGSAVSIAVSAPVDSVSITTDGGDGGTGGKGGRGGLGGDGATTVGPSAEGVHVFGGKGGKGGNGGVGGTGGAGGNAGSITLSVDQDVSGGVILSATGGTGGQGGAGGAGGKGGSGGSASAYYADATSGTGGDGGDGADAGSPGPEGFFAAANGGSAFLGNTGIAGQSLPEQYRGDVGEDGAGGTITVALNAAVGGDVTADAGDGRISVTLNNGASVGGTISANEAASSVLRFAMTVRSKAEYNRAKAQLGAASAMSGTITINGRSYSWSGFDQLIDALTLAGLRKKLNSAAPDYLSCSPRLVTAFVKDGVIEIVARRTAEAGAFRIGRIAGGGFVSQNSIGWTARLIEVARGLGFEVLDRSGEVVSTCRQ